MEKTEKKTIDAPTGDGLIQMVITFNPRTERVQVYAPLARTGLCYEMIELARDVVRRVDDESRRAALVAPPPGFDAKGAGHA